MEILRVFTKPILYEASCQARSHFIHWRHDWHVQFSWTLLVFVRSRCDFKVILLIFRSFATWCRDFQICTSLCFVQIHKRSWRPVCLYGFHKEWVAWKQRVAHIPHQFKSPKFSQVQPRLNQCNAGLYQKSLILGEILQHFHVALSSPHRFLFKCNK